MAKNGEMLHVFDADGNEIGQTYPKRAEGLIKKGRARRTGDDSIVLCDDAKSDIAACPIVDIHTEDTAMDINDTTVNEAEAEERETIPAETAIPEMPAELKRLYDKLDEIDGYIAELNSNIELDTNCPDEISESFLTAMANRMEIMLKGFMEIRRDTVKMIEEFRRGQYEYEYALKRYVSEQIETAKDRCDTLIDDLYILLGDEIDEETYRRRYDMLCKTTDERVMRLLGMIK